MASVLKGAAVVAQGGGPTHVLNASLAGVLEEAARHPQITALYGGCNGAVGLAEGRFIDLRAQDASLISAIGETPGAALGSSRREITDEAYQRILAVFRAHNVRYFFYNGGNGSMGAALRISRMAREANYDLRVIGIPKTIDNDLTETDHCPGYPSAARFFASAVRDVGEDNRSLPAPIDIVETMGRNVGWLVAATVLARSERDDAPHLIYFPERPISEDQVLGDVEAVYRRLGRCVVAVCEGQMSDKGEPFGADWHPAETDWHKLASNLGHSLAQFITRRLKLRARAEKPGLLGRSSAALASPVDRAEARLCGHAAVRAAVAGETDQMVTLVREPGPVYRSTTGLAGLESVARDERRFPLEWIGPAGNDVMPGFRDYLAPLAGEIAPHPHLAPRFVPPLVKS